MKSARGLALRAAHDGNLWLTGGDRVVVRRRVRGEPSRHRLPLPEGRIVVVRPDGSRRQVTVGRPVIDIIPNPRGLIITVSEQPISVDASGHTSHSYPRSTVLLGWDDRSTRVRISDLPVIPAPRRPTRRWRWHDPRPDSVRVSAIEGLGLLWSAGRPVTGSAPDRHVLVTGHHPTSLAERLRVDFGIGELVDVAVVEAELWLAIRRGRLVDLDHPVQVVAVTAAGQTRVVLDGQAIDITDRCRPLTAQDEDTRIGYPRREQHHLANLQSFWERPDGTTTPLADGMTDSATAVHGTWPDTVLRSPADIRADPAPCSADGFRCFDEFGRPTSPAFPAIHLMEDLDTGRLPPVDDAHDGILDF